MKLLKEEMLEPVARWYRMWRAMTYLPKGRLTLIDIGCGPEAVLGRKIGRRLARYVGIDPLIKIGKHPGHWRFIKQSIDKKIDLATGMADVVISLASVEHVDHPREVIKEAIRILKPGGKLILTTPSPRAKKLLEFLSFRMGLISAREIREHKNYFDRLSLKKMLVSLKVSKIEHHYFELGLNNLLVVTK